MVDEIYGSINNLLDQDPPRVCNGAVTTPRSANGDRHDYVGRYLALGVRFKH